MNKKTLRNFIITGSMFLLFVIFTLIVAFVDVKTVGPRGSEVGLATINKWFFRLVGVRPVFNVITQILAIVALAVAVAFCGLGVYQAIKRKSIKKVDKDLVIMGIIYLLTAVVYVFFELVVVNCRPIMVGGELAASYPSSHVLLSVVIMGTAFIWVARKAFKEEYKVAAYSIIAAIALIAPIGRLLAGRHWLTDVIGGLLIATTIVMLYYSCINFEKTEALVEEQAADAEVVGAPVEETEATEEKHEEV